MTDPLSSQSSDVLQYLCSYLNTTTKLQLWQTSQRFRWLVSERVPIQFWTGSYYIGQEWLKIFKQVKITLLNQWSGWCTQYDRIQRFENEVRHSLKLQAKHIICIENPPIDFTEVLPLMVNLQKVKLMYEQEISDTLRVRLIEQGVSVVTS